MNANAAPSEFDQADIEKNKVFAILAYIGILVLVPLLVAKDSKFARFHANQGLILLIAWVIFFVATNITGLIFGGIPILGALISLLLMLLNVVPLIFVVLGIINAAQGQAKPLPYIGHFIILK